MNADTFAVFIAIGVAVAAAIVTWRNREDAFIAERMKERHERERLELEAWKQEALRRAARPIQYHTDGQRRLRYVQEDFGLRRVYEPITTTNIDGQELPYSDEAPTKPKREPRYAVGDDGELVAVTDDAPPKRKRKDG